MIKLQCVIYLWIRLNEFYKQMESFFQISILFSNYWPKTEKYSNRVNIDRSAMCYISMDLTRQPLQTNGELFSNFGIIFRISYNFLNNCSSFLTHSCYMCYICAFKFIVLSNIYVPYIYICYPRNNPNH